MGSFFALVVGRINSRSSYVNVMVGRLVHLNEVLGYFLPSLAYVLSCATVGGSQLAFRPFTDDVDKLSQSYEPIVRELLSPKSADVIFDIGANIGVHTVWLSKSVGPSGLIIAVEPESNNFRILDLNQRLNGLSNVVAVETALASAAKTGALLVPRPTLMGQASIQPSHVTPKSYSIKIDFDTLDNLVFSRQFPTVSAIKIDVEGAETLVLRGAVKTVARFRPRLIIEVHSENNLCEIRDFLESMDMTILMDTLASPRSDESRHFILAVPRTANT